MTNEDLEVRVAEYLKFGLVQVFDGTGIRDIEVSAYRKIMLDKMILRVKMLVLGEKLPQAKYEVKDRFTFFWPSSWWQHFKFQYRERWWMRRFERRWPVKTQHETAYFRGEIRIDPMILYPDLKPPIEGLGRIVLTHNMFMTTDTSNFEEDA